MSNRNANRSRALLLAYEKGYRITEDGKVINPNGKEVKGSINEGYLEIGIRVDKKTQKLKVHRLQGYQKFGERIFEEGIVLRHLNSNSLDNSWDNIGIGSHSDNMNDIPEEIRLKKALHATSFTKKHNYEEVKAYYAEVKSYKKVMERFNISSKGTLNFILNSKY